MENKKLGNQGERIVESYLVGKGYLIFENNYLKRIGEIDLIALDVIKKEIVFVEVKTRRTHTFGYPEEAVNLKKMEKMEKTALSWLEENKKLDTLWRMDLVSVEMGKEMKITHLENITL